MKSLKKLSVALAAVLMIVIGTSDARAHCDSLDGPVVKAAQKALESGNINHVLIWVRKQDEPEITAAFQKTLAIRKLSPEARDLADMYFFETLVRIHRAAEGAPYTGLKPAGRDLGPAIPAADKALETGSADAVLKMLTDAMREGVTEHLNTALSRKKFGKDDVENGREFVESYVVFIHYVEGLYDATKSAAHGHFPEAAAALNSDTAGDTAEAWWRSSAVDHPVFSL
jgi:hypothetical protein